MARPLRIEYAGAFYHVMNRGSGRERIFYHRKHYEMFFDLLQESSALWEIQIHAFSLLPNHYHMLIETPLSNLSRAMRHINGVYTQRLNRQRGVDGHLFRGRYKAILVEEDAYLVELVRYIHLNPVKTGLVKKPEQHQWTSHQYYLGGKRLEWLRTERVLRYFGRRRNLARRKLHEFVMEGVPQGLEIRLDRGRWPSVLSGENFEEWVRWNFVKGMQDKEVQFEEYHPKEASEKRLRGILCKLLDIKWSNLRGACSREERQKRAQAIWFYRWYLKKGYGELSSIFGIRPARISRIMSQKEVISPELLELVHRQI